MRMGASLVAQTVKNLPAMQGELGSIPELGRSPGGGHGNPLQYSSLENPHGQSIRAGYSPWGCKELNTTEWLSTQWLSTHGVCGPQFWPRWAWGAYGMPMGRCPGDRWTHGPRIHIEGWSQRYMFRSQEINDNSSCRSAWDVRNRHQTHRRGSKAEPWRTQHSKRAEDKVEPAREELMVVVKWKSTQAYLVLLCFTESAFFVWFSQNFIFFKPSVCFFF